MRRRKHRAVAANGEEHVHLVELGLLDRDNRLLDEGTERIDGAEFYFRMHLRPGANLFQSKDEVRTLVFESDNAYPFERSFHAPSFSEFSWTSTLLSLSTIPGKHCSTTST